VALWRTGGYASGRDHAGGSRRCIDHSQNWDAYKKYFDPEGNATLHFPVFAGTGNHDLSDSTAQQFSYLERAHIQQNKQRPAPLNLGPKGYHYSWDWSGIHFVCLNIFPGTEARPVYGNPAPWNDPKNALAFLKRDLAEEVGQSDRPVILSWHYGLRVWGLEKWWTEEDLATLKSALAGYDVVLILHGQEHRCERYEWAGYDIVMGPAPYSPGEGPDAESTPKGFLVLRATPDSLQMAHHGPRGWEDTWAKPLEAKTSPAQEITAAGPRPGR
jgi:cytolysin (calcineurin-like family phosphatase)